MGYCSIQNELFWSGSDLDEVVEILVVELHEFQKHPFHVLDDESMNELLTRIKDKGILEPLLLRERKSGGCLSRLQG